MKFSFVTIVTEFIFGATVLSNKLNIILLVTKFNTFDFVDILKSSDVFRQDRFFVENLYLLATAVDGTDLTEAVISSMVQQFTSVGFNPNLEYLRDNTELLSPISMIIKRSSLYKQSVLIVADCFEYSHNFLTEISNISDLDEKFGFISPRSNLLTITSYTPTVQKRRNLFKRPRYYSRLEDLNESQRTSIAQYNIVPVLPIVNTFLSGSMLQLTTKFTAQFETDNSWLDFITSCNNMGYLSLIANFAEAFETTNDNLLPSKLTLLDTEDESINTHLKCTLERFVYSETNSYENLVIARYYFKKPSILIDLSNLTNIPNGTSKLNIELLKAIMRVNMINDMFDLTVLISNLAYEAFDLSSWLKGVDIIFDASQIDKLFTLRVLLSQPLSLNTAFQHFRFAPLNLYYFLDTIASDCNYLENERPGIPVFWKFVAEFANSLCFLSEVGMNDFSNRYYRRNGENDFYCWASVDPKNYALSDGIGELTSDSAELKTVTIFVVGNHFEHKRVNYFTDLLHSSFSNIKIISLGYSGTNNVIKLNSGTERKDVIEKYYSSADLIVFPSVFEGFGFPIIEALAADKPVVYVKSKLTDELLKTVKLAGYSNLLLEGDSDDSLLQMIGKFIDSWQSGEKHRYSIQSTQDNVHLFNWDDAANVFVDHFKKLICDIKSFDSLKNALLFIETAQLSLRDPVNLNDQTFMGTSSNQGQIPVNLRRLIKINEELSVQIMLKKYPKTANKLKTLKRYLRRIK